MTLKGDSCITMIKCGDVKMTVTYVQRWALCNNHLANIEVSVKWVEVVALLSCESWIFVKENPDRKKKDGKILNKMKNISGEKTHNITPG